jgi:hypothetical protein
LGLAQTLVAVVVLAAAAVLVVVAVAVVPGESTVVVVVVVANARAWALGVCMGLGLGLGLGPFVVWASPLAWAWRPPTSPVPWTLCVPHPARVCGACPPQLLQLWWAGPGTQVLVLVLGMAWARRPTAQGPPSGLLSTAGLGQGFRVVGEGLVAVVAVVARWPAGVASVG